MDPALGPLSSLPSLTQALLLRQGLPPGDVEILVKAMGQELAIRYLGQGAEGAQLELPGGRVVTAQGEVPFPVGTQLRVRVASEQGALRLQTLEAKPPATPSLLAPLMQGEAASLVARLQQPAPPTELAPLVQLFRALMEAPEAAKSELPSVETLAHEIASLPKALAASLAKALGAGTDEPPAALAQHLLSAQTTGIPDRAVVATPGELLARVQNLLKQPDQAPLLRALLEAPMGDVSKLPTVEALSQEIASLPKALVVGLAKALGAGTDEPPAALAQRLLSAQTTGIPDRAVVATPGELLALVHNLLRQADIAPEPRGALETWILGLLGRRTPETNVARALPSSQGSRILSRAEMTKVAVALGANSAAPMQVPDVWEAWVKGALRTLADPELSPREAPFHAVQGKEGTAFFEIPLPWAGAKPLQLWVEQDAPEARGMEEEPVTRVLIGLHFTRLGETRVGLQRSGDALSARVWTEHPELLEAQKAQIEQELHDIAAMVDLRILALEPGPEGNIPDLRALVVGGGSVHALG